MKSAPLVSVLVPVYNGAAILSDALTSVQQQTCQNFEIIAVDDGSTDDSHALLQQFGERDRRVKVLRQTNNGTQVARNAALRHASGEWIALLDQDDVWLPQKLESQIALLTASPRANLLFTNYINWDGVRDLGPRYTKRHKFPDGDVGATLVRWCLFGASTVMIRRTAVEKLGGFDPEFHLSGDWDLWLRLAETGLLAKGVWEPQARYRIWAGNESNKTLDVVRETAGVLEKALLRPQTQVWRRRYQKSLALARVHLEFKQLWPQLETQPKVAAAAVWRAWRGCPEEIKLLMMYLGLIWPRWLGGDQLSQKVYRKIRRKWQTFHP